MAAENSEYSQWGNQRLIVRVTELENQLKEQTALLASRTSSPKPAEQPTRKKRPFDASKHSTRHIALKFAYLGQRYNGYEHHNGNVTPLPTIEGTLLQALRKTYLINPPDVEGLGKNEISWEGCDYSKCGRTDRGVSAFGQVVGVRVRSRRPLPKQRDQEVAEKEEHGSTGLEEDGFDDVLDEMPYVNILNNVLPPDIRVLAWCPNPPEGFSARFSCKERRYRYFFTQPAFSPTPGPIGIERVPGAKFREGWLDIEAMREGAKKLTGLHDFRNFCKVDASKQMSNFMRRIAYADIEVLDPSKEPAGYVAGEGFQRHGSGQVNGEHSNAADLRNPSGIPLVYSFDVHGSAFLWHQVRCMVSVLFLIGQGLESPELVTRLLDVESNPRKPSYEMATDAPLVLWDCIFPEDGKVDHMVDSLNWIYAGDSRQLGGVPGQSDGKYGLGGVVDSIWSIWRQRKIDEVLAGTLLDLVAGQGDGTQIARSPQNLLAKGHKLFEGRDSPRLGGKYTPLMQRPLMETVEVQNAKYLARKGKTLETTEAEDTNE